MRVASRPDQELETQGFIPTKGWLVGAFAQAHALNTGMVDWFVRRKQRTFRGRLNALPAERSLV